MSWVEIDFFRFFMIFPPDMFDRLIIILCKLFMFVFLPVLIVEFLESVQMKLADEWFIFDPLKLFRQDHLSE